MKRPITALALSLLLATAAHAGRYVTRDIVEDALAFATTDRTKAIALLEDALAHRQGYKPKEEVRVMLNAGEQRRLMGDFKESRAWFTRVLSATSRGFEAESARLGLALVDAADGLTPQVLDTLQAVKERDALATQNADRYLILTMRAARQNDAPGARAWSELALRYADEDPAVGERVRAHLEALVDEDSRALVYRPTSPTPEETLTSSVESDLVKAERALEAGNPERASRLAEKVRDDPEADEGDRRAATYLLRRLDGARVQPGKIGVILPLSERFEAAGRQVQRAFEFGYAKAGGRAQLVYADSGSTAETAVAALEKLVLEDGVIAVVGPLLTEEALPVAEAAEALRVPLVGLSQGLDATAERAWVYQAMVTPADQVQALVAFAMGERGMKSFAIFAPDSNYGRAAAEAFQAEVELRKGKIAIVEYYDAAATDLIPFAKKLGRKDYSARSAEFQRLKREAADKGGNPDSVVLPPTLDFDALFVPDNASRIPIAAAALAYEEFPLGQFRTSRDGATLPMLGLSGWNNPALVSQGGPYVQGAIFTDSFVVDDTASQAFSSAYEAEVGKAPTPLEAVTADAGRLLAATLKTRPETRAAFREALAGLQVEGAITGATGFGPDHEARRRIRVLAIEGDSILPLDTPQVTEGPAPTP